MGYHPGHPWYYLRAGDGKAPIPFADIPAAKDAGRFLGRELPKSPAKRIIKARALLEDERQKLEDDRRRYQDIIERGVEALSRYDRGIAYGGQRAELAVASSLALKFNHIAWRKGRIAFLENERSDPRRPGR